MLIEPWDASVEDDEWQRWLLAGHDFGQLAVNHLGNAPLVVPTHFAVDRGGVLIHLSRRNPMWPAIEADPAVLLSVVDDYAYIPTSWRARPGRRAESGVPTSYYAAVQLTCHATIVDAPEEKAALLRSQLAHFQPAGDHADVVVGQPPYGGMLAGIRGLRLQVEGVEAKFKYDDHKSEAHRTLVARKLDARGEARDAGAATQQRRRLGLVGGWRSWKDGRQKEARAGATLPWRSGLD